MHDLQHDDHQELRAQALALRCPRCGANAGVSCAMNPSARKRIHYAEGVHPERLAAAEGLAGKENRQRTPRRGWGQRRADPELRVRRIEDEDEQAA